MKITVRIKGRFGHSDIWPADDKAKEILELLNGGKRKCFSPKQIKFIKAMGVEVEVETPKI